MSVAIRPCDNCGVNVEQAILYDEVTCYKTCKKWKRWSKQREREVKLEN